MSLPPAWPGGVEVRAVEQLAFEGCEEALGHGVVEAIPDRAHRGGPSPAALAEGEGGVLAAWVAVVDDRVRAALLYGHVQGVEHELGAQMPGHRPPIPAKAGIRRLNPSRTMARDTKPARVGT